MPVTRQLTPGPMVPKRHHRWYLCWRDFETERALREHVERRHPNEDVHWWVVVEAPARDLHFSSGH